jgi:hypothetical protein
VSWRTNGRSSRRIIRGHPDPIAIAGFSFDTNSTRYRNDHQHDRVTHPSDGMFRSGNVNLRREVEILNWFLL